MPLLSGVRLHPNLLLSDCERELSRERCYFCFISSHLRFSFLGGPRDIHTTFWTIVEEWWLVWFHRFTVSAICIIIDLITQVLGDEDVIGELDNHISDAYLGIVPGPSEVPLTNTQTTSSAVDGEGMILKVSNMK